LRSLESWTLIALVLVGAVVARAAGAQKAIASTNLTILGFTLGQNEITDVESKLGKAPSSDSSRHDMMQHCYQSTGPDRTILVLEDWVGTLSGFRLFRSGTTKQDCARTAAVTADISTASGLKLGLTREQVLAILGTPTRALSNQIIYRSETTRHMTANELARFKKAYPGEDISGLDVFLTTEIKVGFKDSKVSSIEAIHTETT